MATTFCADSPAMFSVEDVNRCQIQEWYPKFKSVSIKTLIHELPESFVAYLNDSGSVFLPLSLTDALPNRIRNPDDEEDFQIQYEDEDEDEDDEDEDEDEDESEPASTPSAFPELEAEIQQSIETLGGAVSPKLNWSAPKDAVWISNTGTLKCSSFSEIALLLRSSDSIDHDLNHAYDSCDDKSSESRPPRFFLALRKWYDSLKPEMEFRCFVRDHVLIGVSQREITGYYPALVERQDELSSMIMDFYEDNLQDEFESRSYTFDVYVTEDGRVKLLDFNTWGGPTLPLLFTWEELEGSLNESEELPEFRIVDGKFKVQPGFRTAVPYDYIDRSPGSGWDQFFNIADEKLRQQTTSGGKAGA